ncbi:MAG TPA: ATP phosphoribosyltransferase [Limnochordales bacterium]|nr:ATP phosphoribosyltransferase [Limnochordales bacterium]
MTGRPLTIALPKGRLLTQVLPLLAAAGLDTEGLGASSRRLVLDRGPVRFLICRAADVPTFVEYGAADVGIAGKDVLWEAGRDVAELLDLGVGRCRLVVAVPQASGLTRVQELDFNSRVATKYPRIARRYFNEQGIQVEVIPLHGNIELAPLVGLADAVVDVTETGRTLRDNGLAVVASIGVSTARLIANPVRYKIRSDKIDPLVAALGAAVPPAASPGS